MNLYTFANQCPTSCEKCKLSRLHVRLGGDCIYVCPLTGKQGDIKTCKIMPIEPILALAMEMKDEKISEFLQFAKTVQHLTDILVVTILVSIIAKNEKSTRMLKTRGTRKETKNICINGRTYCRSVESMYIIDDLIKEYENEE